MGLDLCFHGVGRVWRCPDDDNLQRLEFFLILKAILLSLLPCEIPRQVGVMCLMEEEKLSVRKAADPHCGLQVSVCFLYLHSCCLHPSVTFSRDH